MFTDNQKNIKHEQCLLGDLVESPTTDIAYNEPNQTTKAAMDEARSGKLNDETPVDTSSVDAMFKSAGL